MGACEVVFWDKPILVQFGALPVRTALLLIRPGIAPPVAASRDLDLALVGPASVASLRIATTV